MRTILLTLVLFLLVACGDRPPASPRVADTTAQVPLPSEPGACLSNDYAVGLYDRLMHPRRWEPDEAILLLEDIERLDDPCKVDSLLAFAERFPDRRSVALWSLTSLRADTLAPWVERHAEELDAGAWRAIAIKMWQNRPREPRGTGSESWREDQLAALVLVEAAPDRYTPVDRSYMVEAFAHIGTLDEVLTLAERYEAGDAFDAPASGTGRGLFINYNAAFARYNHPRLNALVEDALARAGGDVGLSAMIAAKGLVAHGRHDFLGALRRVEEMVAEDTSVPSLLRARLSEGVVELEAAAAAGEPVGVPLSWPDTTAIP